MKHISEFLARAVESIERAYQRSGDEPETKGHAALAAARDRECNEAVPHHQQQ